MIHSKVLDVTAIEQTFDDVTGVRQPTHHHLMNHNIARTSEKKVYDSIVLIIKNT